MMLDAYRTNILLALVADPVRHRFVNDTVLLAQCPAPDLLRGNLCGIKGLH
jgi:hypothetical protein